MIIFIEIKKKYVYHGNTIYNRKTNNLFYHLGEGLLSALSYRHGSAMAALSILASISEVNNSITVHTKKNSDTAIVVVFKRDTSLYYYYRYYTPSSRLSQAR